MDKDLLARVGFPHYSAEEFDSEKIVLRGGQEAVLWVHADSGHAILDPKFWVGSDYYQEEYRSEYSAESAGTRVEPEEHFNIYRDLNEKQFAQFAEHLTSETRYLEIGCSFGGVLKLVADFGVGVCHGIEPNEEDTQFIQKVCPQAKIFNSTFEDLDLKSEYYDVVTSFEALEHMVSPGSILQKTAGLMKHNGVINIEVPNHKDLLLSCYENIGYESFYYHKAHIHYFTKESLSNLLEVCGFDGATSSFLMYPLFNHVFWHQNRSPQPSAQVAMATPRPSSEKSAAGVAINEFFARAEKEYETIVNQYMVGDCLVYQGKRRE
jgi:2-polyprenyl-3-methyl-5-hydroxy-6-metoxy-1,4-benzoquinol methylase